MSQLPFGPESIEQVVALIIGLFKRQGFLSNEDPTLAHGFRCPKDGSSRTSKISELLASRPRGTFRWEGKSVSFVGGDERLDGLDPGPEPGDMRGVIYLGSIVGLVGCLIAVGTNSPINGFGWGIAGFGGLAALLARQWDRDLNGRHAAWKEKRDRADTHWLCDPCGHVFLPKGTREGNTVSDVKRPDCEHHSNPEDGGEEGAGPENVALLQPRD